MSKQVFPEPTVGALIFNKKGELFLMRSHKWRGKYVIPGGHIELGEKIEVALKREIKEETNLNIFGLEFICLQEFIYDKKYWKKRHFIFFDYAAKTRSIKVKLNSEGQSYVWATLKDAFKLPIEIFTKRAILKYMELKKIR